MPHTQIDKDVQDLEGWYLSEVRPFLEKIGKIDPRAGRIEDFDADLEQLRRARETFDDDLVACFLGAAGVGKSTLINALVDGRRSTLPHGGIGPLTAQALSVRRASHAGLEATYHPRGQVWKLIKALEWGFRVQSGQANSSEAEAIVEEDGDSNDLPPEDLMEIIDQIRSDSPESRSRMESYKKQAQLLIKGQQDAETPVAYLIDALRFVLGMEPKWGRKPEDQDRDRVARIREALTEGKRRFTGTVSDEQFDQVLKDHATGFMAPLIASMKVDCESDKLPDGVVLVDLPGLGVAGDIHKEVTSRWLREQARVVILVVGNRGIQEADAKLLQESGFLNRLIYTAEDPTEDPVSLTVVVVRVDEIAETRFQAAYQRGDTAKPPSAYFADACEEAQRLVVSQLKPQLEKAWASGQIQDAQAQVIENLLANLEVHPVSAVEYSRFQIDNPYLRPFLDSAEQTNIPTLLDSLRRQARERHSIEVRRLEAVKRSFLDRLDSTLRLIQAQWQEADRATVEAERLREEFLDFIDPLRGEFRSRQGAYREFLRETLPQTIRTELEKAGRVARKEISAYLQPFQSVHWKTLQATVNKGGTFVSGVGRQIDLPNDFALRFEVPVADAWAKCVLKEIRRRTKDFADDCIRLVEQVVDWAKAQGTRVQPMLVEAQRDSIKADMKALETVGRIMVDQLRQDVSTRLVKKIEMPIRRRCRKFVEDQEHTGTGAKRRMLDLFSELADLVTDAAIEPAEAILLETFRKVQEEILAVLNKHSDPLDAARDAIIDAHEKYVRRSDAQRRRQVLADVESVLESRPQPPPDDDLARVA